MQRFVLSGNFLTVKLTSKKDAKKQSSTFEVTDMKTDRVSVLLLGHPFIQCHDLLLLLSQVYFVLFYRFHDGQMV